MIERVRPTKGTLKEMMDQVERWLLIEALREHQNNKTAAAKNLGITREGLHKKLRVVRALRSRATALARIRARVSAGPTPRRRTRTTTARRSAGRRAPGTTSSIGMSANARSARRGCGTTRRGSSMTTPSIQSTSRSIGAGPKRTSVAGARASELTLDAEQLARGARAAKRALYTYCGVQERGLLAGPPTGAVS